MEQHPQHETVSAPSPPPPPPRPTTPPLQPPERRKRHFPWVLVIVLAGVFGILGFTTLVASFLGGGETTVGGSRWSHEKIAVIHVAGLITSGSSGASMFGPSVCGSRDVVKQLKQAREDDDVKAVLLRINSPGGSAAGSQEIYEGVLKTRKTGKPVVASLADVAASGGYYVASAADRIVAQAATLTGSIGVLMSFTDMSELFKKIGYQPVTLKAGEHKDMGSSARPLTEEEREMLQAMLDDVHAQFIEDVAKGRGWPRSRVEPLADGRIFTGRQAAGAGLVDELGTFARAVEVAAKAAGLKGEPALMTYGRRSLLEQLFETSAGAAGRAAANALSERLDPGAVGRMLYQPGLQ